MYDTDKEVFYHGLMIGLYVVLDENYSIKSNRESGLGRFDIQMEPYDKTSAGIIIELKVLQNPKVQDKDSIAVALDELSKTALKQIDEKDYAQDMRDNGIKTFFKYGIAFYKKFTSVSSKEDII